ncbi:MAG: TMEM175 family protein [Myxococcota bacterium]
MIRRAFTQQLDHDPDFQWRGDQVTRIENLSDIVFALAFSMIVTASDIPFTLDGIRLYLVSIVPVSAAFAVMLVTWNRHFLFFRRYGLADNRIVWLNALLLLTILSIAYPLRFIFESLFAYILLVFGNLDLILRIGLDSYESAGEVVCYFGLIFSVLQLLFARMYARALEKRDTLQLSAIEIDVSRQALWSFRIGIALGLIAAVCAYYTVLGPFSGFIISLSTPMRWLLQYNIRSANNHG